MLKFKSKKNMTIKYLGEQWLENKKMTVKPSTYANYSRLLNDHIIPALGRFKYESLDKSDITEIERVVKENFNATVTFTKVAEAAQYRESLKLEQVVAV